MRLKGAIGLKYLEITLGSLAARASRNNAVVPMRQESNEVDFDQVLSMFTPPTRKGVQQSTLGFGQALAGRGLDLNNAIGAFGPLLRDLEPVAANLASPSTDLGGFFRSLERYTGALTPVAEAQGQLFANLNTTFRALAGVAVPSLQETISDTPPMFDATIANTPGDPPVPHRHGGAVLRAAPGVATLPQSAPVLSQRLRHGHAQPAGTGRA